MEKKVSLIQIVLTRTKTNTPIKANELSTGGGNARKIKHKANNFGIRDKRSKEIQLKLHRTALPIPNEVNHSCDDKSEKKSKDIQQCKTFELHTIKSNHSDDKQVSFNKSAENIKKKQQLNEELNETFGQIERKDIELEFNNVNCFKKSNCIQKSSNCLSFKKQLTPVVTPNKEADSIQTLNTKLEHEEGYCQISKREQLNSRYEVLKTLGKGSFGQAIKCIDLKTNEYVCIKIIKSQRKYYSLALSEIEMLNYLKQHQLFNETNIVLLKDHFLYHNHMCLVFDLLSLNLYEVLKAQKFIGFDLATLKKFATQLLFSLLMLKTASIVHCDLKPENILLIKSNRTGLKLIDFGLSCFEDKAFDEYIQSRYYRAPEVLLGARYGCEIDMWSFGCIFAELFNGYPIFPGENAYDQLSCIMEYRGLPGNELLLQAKRRDFFFDNEGQPLYLPNSRGKVRRPSMKTVEHFLRRSDAEFVDFIEKCLTWLPSERLTPYQALNHKWILSEMPQNLIEAHQRQIEALSRKSSYNVFVKEPSTLISYFEAKIKTSNEQNGKLSIDKLDKAKKKLFNQPLNIHINLSKSSKKKEADL